MHRAFAGGDGPLGDPLIPQAYDGSDLLLPQAFGSGEAPRRWWVSSEAATLEEQRMGIWRSAFASLGGSWSLLAAPLPPLSPWDLLALLQLVWAILACVLAFAARRAPLDLADDGPVDRYSRCSDPAHHRSHQDILPDDVAAAASAGRFTGSCPAGAQVWHSRRADTAAGAVTVGRSGPRRGTCGRS